MFVAHGGRVALNRERRAVLANVHRFEHVMTAFVRLADVSADLMADLRRKHRLDRPPCQFFD